MNGFLIGAAVRPSPGHKQSSLNPRIRECGERVSPLIWKEDSGRNTTPYWHGIWLGNVYRSPTPQSGFYASCMWGTDHSYEADFMWTFGSRKTKVERMGSLSWQIRAGEIATVK